MKEVKAKGHTRVNMGIYTTVFQVQLKDEANGERISTANSKRYMISTYGNKQRFLHLGYMQEQVEKT